VNTSSPMKLQLCIIEDLNWTIMNSMINMYIGQYLKRTIFFLNDYKTSNIWH